MKDKSFPMKSLQLKFWRLWLLGLINLQEAALFCLKSDEEDGMVKNWYSKNLWQKEKWDAKNRTCLFFLEDVCPGNPYVITLNLRVNSQHCFYFEIYSRHAKIFFIKFFIFFLPETWTNIKIGHTPFKKKTQHFTRIGYCRRVDIYKVLAWKKIFNSMMSV